jgi:cytochrome o ubiquinol oxidase subunit 3
MSATGLTDHHDEHEHHDDTDTCVFGFWIYIMTDCVLFGVLFATFAVLHDNSYNGFGLKTFLDLPYVLAETLFLLASSFTCGMAILGMYVKNKSRVITWLCFTLLLGLAFVAMEVNEFHHLILEGHGPSSSGEMSAFFTLVGTHGLHVSFGLFWMLIMIFQVAKCGLTKDTMRRLTFLGLFWAFLDVVWIFVYTVVYLIGGM